VRASVQRCLAALCLCESGVSRAIARVREGLTIPNHEVGVSARIARAREASNRANTHKAYR